MLTFFIISALVFGLIIPWLIIEMRGCPSKTRLKVFIYLDDLDCFEPTFEKVVHLCSCSDLQITVVDLLNSAQSRMWMRKLQEKYRIYFDVITPKGDDDGARIGNHTRQC